MHISIDPLMQKFSDTLMGSYSLYNCWKGKTIRNQICLACGGPGTTVVSMALLQRVESCEYFTDGLLLF